MPNLPAYTQIQQTLKLVPAGTVVSYGQLADLAGLPGRARLVGRCLKEAGSEALPWHRVLRADGKIAFPAGSDAAGEQRQRLIAEGVMVRNYRVKLSEFGWQPDSYTLLHRLQF
ncbi:MGMT family protein [Alteromonas halophila]|uniref:Methylated-DNA--protein-cysteine methyltransferase n=1 Tax=Alteromonas halophila TaxID=516698 RepID=A0A918N082_9ALTE|nr:MGMT family protein [Alteromonas halophila]GGW96591.1 methylated-DNA--protein-cysteine methyltransferase [Alteromonas halophila]